MENRNGLVGGGRSDAGDRNGRARGGGGFQPALAQGATLSADKGYDAEAFVEGLKARGIAPHVAINGTGERAWQDAQDRGPERGRRECALCHLLAGCASASRKASAGRRRSAVSSQVKVRGLAKVRAAFVLAMAADNIVRLPKLLAPRGEARPAT